MTSPRSLPPPDRRRAYTIQCPHCGDLAIRAASLREAIRLLKEHAELVHGEYIEQETVLS